MKTYAIARCWLGLMGWLGVLGTIAIGVNDHAVGEIVPDASLGAESSIVTPNTVIRGLPSDRIDGGAIRGSNLFHSFQQFNIGEGRGAYFANPAGVENILSRVTGNSRSEILGRLGVLGNANLFLLNPNGIVFGSNASLDVTGSFTATTANAIALGNQGFFSATQPESSNLLAIAPGALFFDQQVQQPRTIQNSGNLTAGRDLTLSADNLELQGQVRSGGNLTLHAQDTLRIRDSVTNPFIAAASGQLLVQGDRSVDIFALNHPDSGVFSGGDMVLRSANQVGGDAHYYSGGNFRIEKIDGGLGNLYSPNDPIILVAGNLFLNNYIGASLHILAGGFVYIPGTIEITGADTNSTALIENVNLSDGTVLPIDGTARPTLDIRAGIDLSGVTIPGGIAIIGSGTFPGGGDFDSEPFDSGIVLGQVNIIPPNGLVFLTNQYQPNTLLSSAGVVITGRGVTRAGIASPVQGIDAQGFGGNGSSVVIDSRGIIFLREGASIDSSSDFGNAGSIKLTAGESISLDPAASLLSSTSTGRSGDINLDAKEISLDLFASVITQGGGDIRIQGDRLLMYSFSQITNPTQGNQNAGNIFIQMNDSVRNDGGNIGTFVFPGSSGNAGNIDIKTGELSLIGNDLTINGRRFTGGDIGADTTGDSKAGNITIDARRISVLDGAQIRANAGADLLPDGKGNGGSVNIHASELVEVSGSVPSNSNIYSKISSDTYNSGAAGNVSVIVDNGNLIVRDQGAIQSQVQGGSGSGGNVTIKANNVLLEGGGQITAGSFGTGRGGTLTVNTSESVKVTGLYRSGAPSGLFTGTYGGGDAGDISVTTNRLRVQDGGTISASTFAISGQGRGGNVTINAPQFVEVSGSLKNAEGDVFRSSIVAETGRLLEVPGGVEPALGGKLTITTGRLSIRDGARVSTNTYNFAGRAGDLIINAPETVEVIGKNTEGNISSLSAKTNGIGNAGNLTINTGQLSIRGGAEVSTSTSRDNDEFRVQQGGQAGILNVKADLIEVSDAPSGLISSSLLSTGDAGQLNLTTKRLIIRDGATVATSSVLGGRGGDLNVTATDSIVISGQGFTSLANDPFGLGQLTIASNLSAEATSLTNAGNIAIRTDQLIVKDGAEVSARTMALGNAGNIGIQANSITLTNGGLITSQSSGLFTSQSGNAGNIFLNVRGPLQANDGTISTSAAQSSGGAIEITAKDIRLKGNSDITTFVNSGAGGGGNITLTADSILAFNDSDILSFARDGKGGNITLNTAAFFGQNYRPAPPGTDPRTLDGNNRVDVNASGTVSGIITIPDTTFIQNSLTQLSDNLVDPSTLLANSCIVRSRDRTSNGTFLITGSGGLPIRPGDPPPSSFPTGEVRSLPQPQSQTDHPWKIGDPIVEPQGVYRLANGKLVMSRECEQ
ncbi:filamentous hemagglutinin N-terminal domain-containing protein [Phormidesmis priestleyi ULC007]|uniref:Filamentous hemagglutinin N-terminal domain-containing protein n=1 Tax=Phormidesmis priestleyi ULC007 TaxID=1920490 RepID=A0A2T1D811_9CYAN|nr:filamentous hemagglutinin N-terminal domain-containing protein [Phormidesmis priestleyi]PSB16632.1 filamentous hemagglutinin N-terminal domain-containing protein [Phormidesmis priestleyi ULC007]PZO47534.1 MAG: filamentous hemagglutinin N-terminal domain-containing protein [Phormidesmis priestleyi]